MPKAEFQDQLQKQRAGGTMELVLVHTVNAAELSLVLVLVVHPIRGQLV